MLEWLVKLDSSDKGHLIETIIITATALVVVLALVAVVVKFGQSLKLKTIFGTFEIGGYKVKSANKDRAITSVHKFEDDVRDYYYDVLNTSKTKVRYFEERTYNLFTSLFREATLNKYKDNPEDLDRDLYEREVRAYSIIMDLVNRVVLFPTILETMFTVDNCKYFTQVAKGAVPVGADSSVRLKVSKNNEDRTKFVFQRMDKALTNTWVPSIISREEFKSYIHKGQTTITFEKVNGEETAAYKIFTMAQDTYNFVDNIMADRIETLVNKYKDSMFGGDDKMCSDKIKTMWNDEFFRGNRTKSG